ncbi:MAG TPA: response regulator transcription factor, partial [Ilumatobacteraceae bacterium]|nr:response regulator transcription factor [Ilumatobacteraceae bacterium]
RLIDEARAAGADGFISKALSGSEIADALVRVVAGEQVEALGTGRKSPPTIDWPGRSAGLTERESQVLVLCAEGMTNREIADALYIGLETVKSHLRNVFKRLGLRNRTQAAAYADPLGQFRRSTGRSAQPSGPRR